MPSKRKGENGKDNNSWNQNVTYAAVNLTEADKDAFSSWLTNVAEDFGSALTRVLEDLYRVTLKVDVNNNCYMCTWTQQDFKHRNANLTIISRSDDPEEAFWLNIYKVYVLYENQRLPSQQEANTWG